MGGEGAAREAKAATDRPGGDWAGSAGQRAPPNGDGGPQNGEKYPQKSGDGR